MNEDRQILLDSQIDIVSILAPYIFWLPYSYHYNPLVLGTLRTVQQYCWAPTDFQMSSNMGIPQSKAAFYVHRRGLCPWLLEMYYNFKDHDFAKLRKSRHPLFKIPNTCSESKLYIPSTLNIALLQWHTHLNVCAVK